MFDPNSDDSVIYVISEVDGGVFCVAKVTVNRILATAMLGLLIISVASCGHAGEKRSLRTKDTTPMRSRQSIDAPPPQNQSYGAANSALVTVSEGASSAVKSASQEDVMRVIGWAQSNDRGPRDSSDTVLFKLHLDQPDRRTQMSTQCIRASSFLKPMHDSRIFYLVGNTLHVQDSTKVDSEAIVPLPGLDPTLIIEYILAYAQKSPPLSILIVVRGKRGHGFLLLDIDEEKVIDIKPANDLPALKDVDKFFSTFHVPSCKNGQNHCLIINRDGSRTYVDREPTRGAEREEWRQFEAVIHDISYSLGSELFILVSCGASLP